MAGYDVDHNLRIKLFKSKVFLLPFNVNWKAISLLKCGFLLLFTSISVLFLSFCFFLSLYLSLSTSLSLSFSISHSLPGDEIFNLCARFFYVHASLSPHWNVIEWACYHSSIASIFNFALSTFILATWCSFIKHAIGVRILLPLQRFIDLIIFNVNNYYSFSFHFRCNRNEICFGNSIASSHSMHLIWEARNCMHHTWWIYAFILTSI